MGTKLALMVISVAPIGTAALASCSSRIAAGGPDSGPEAGDCDAGPPASALRAISLAMTQVNFGDDPDASAWQAIGFDLGEECAASTVGDTCVPVPGAPHDIQQRGAAGIHNSFGRNISAILDAVAGRGACSTVITQAYLVTDATGASTLAFHLPPYWFEIPIAQAFVSVRDGTGVVGAVVSSSGLFTGVENTSAAASPGVSPTCACGGCDFNSIADQMLQAADVLLGGSNPPGSQCNAISIGMQFFGATAFTGALPDVPDACGS
jgi:hypothetical protein